MVKGYFIQYKFLIPNSVQHSSYSYQKLFRALYGYTQNVSKSNGKSYRYHRPGVLSIGPYIRPGKNCVIIPQSCLSPLFEFFKTGRNPAHKWVGKGEWKAVYYMNEKEVSATEVVKPLENLIDRTYIATPVNQRHPIEEELSFLLNSASGKQKADAAYKKTVLAEALRITSNEWFRLCNSKSEKLKGFASKVFALHKS